MNEDVSRLLLVRACAYHDSHGTSLDEDGTVTESYRFSRCVSHRDVPIIYQNLRCDRDHYTPEERAALAALKTWRLNQINGTVNAEATALMCRVADTLLLNESPVRLDDHSEEILQRWQSSLADTEETNGD